MGPVFGCPLGGSWCGLWSALEAKIVDFGIQNGIKNGDRRKSAVIKKNKENQWFLQYFHGSRGTHFH